MRRRSRPGWRPRARTSSVWVVTGDGDALSIGGNHLIHALRRNVNLKILLFNNRIYGLTKGQYSPTSELGKVTKSTPMGSIDQPFNPVSLALGAEATFVARTVDSDRKHLTEVLRAAAAHRGTALVEIYQNCPIFNDGAFDAIKGAKDSDAANAIIPLRHGEPIRFGVPTRTARRQGRRPRPATGGVAGRRRRRRRRPRPTCSSTTRTPTTRRRRSRCPGSPTAATCTRPRSASSARSSGRRTTTRPATRSRPPAGHRGPRAGARRPAQRRRHLDRRLTADETEGPTERNVLGGELEPCGTEPMTGFFRDGCCRTGPQDVGSHTICAVVTAEFLEQQRRHRQRPVDTVSRSTASPGWYPATAGA